MRRLLTTFILLLIFAPSHAEIYTWTDENGRPVYSQTQKRGAAAVDLKAQPLISNQAETAPATKTTEDHLKAIEQSNAAREQARQETKQQKQLEAERKQNCNNARQSLELLQRGGTTRFQEADGSWVYYTPEQRAERRQNVQQYIEQNCR